MNKLDKAGETTAEKALLRAEKAASEKHKLQQYSLGFGLSLVTTLAAYLLVTHQVFAGWTLVYVIVLLALAQVVIQLIFFLHIGHETEPRWNLLALDFTLMVVVIIVIGSLWIMQNLDYNGQHNQANPNGQSPAETEKFIINDEGYRQ